MKKTTNIQNELHSLQTGAAFLGAGGGGGLAMSHQLIKAIATLGNKINLVSIDDVCSDTNSSLCIVAGVGSPDAGNTQTDFSSYQNVLKSMKSRFPNLQYVLPGEIGAVNSLVPLYAATSLGLSVIDCDPAGRAVPEMTMTVLNCRDNITISPVFVATNTITQTTSYTSICINETQAETVENQIREIISTSLFQCNGAIAFYPMTCQEFRILKDDLYPNSISRSTNLGTFFNSNKVTDIKDIQGFIRPISDIIQRKVRLLCEGTIVNQTCASGGFDSGYVQIINYELNNEYWIYYKNENILLWGLTQQAPIAMAPDSICSVWYDSSKQLLRPFSNADIGSPNGPQFNDKVYVWGVQSIPQLQKPREVNLFMNDVQLFKPILQYISLEQQ